jgi:beta-xylosidase
VSIWKKPIQRENTTRALPQTSDDFSDGKLGLQWQWNHNPVDTHWRIRPADGPNSGGLVLKALYAKDFLSARNTLTQKLMGWRGRIAVTLNLSGLCAGQRAGLAFLAGKQENWIGIEYDAAPRLEAVTGGVRFHGPEISAESIHLRADIDIDGETRFSFSLNGSDFIKIGGQCTLTEGFWKGARVALFNYNQREGDSGDSMGTAEFKRFRYEVLD